MEVAQAQAVDLEALAVVETKNQLMAVTLEAQELLVKVLLEELEECLAAAQVITTGAGAAELEESVEQQITVAMVVLELQILSRVLL
jgi:hypothetical protein